jgi:hypothetical protein
VEAVRSAELVLVDGSSGDGWGVDGGMTFLKCCCCWLLLVVGCCCCCCLDESLNGCQQVEVSLAVDCDCHSPLECMCLDRLMDLHGLSLSSSPSQDKCILLSA